jgi:hypothetical protein
MMVHTNGPLNHLVSIRILAMVQERIFFMHKKIIAMVYDEYDIQKLPYIEGWITFPRPNVQHFSYSEQQEDTAKPGKKDLSLQCVGFWLYDTAGPA